MFNYSCIGRGIQSPAWPRINQVQGARDPVSPGAVEDWTGHRAGPGRAPVGSGPRVSRACERPRFGSRSTSKASDPARPRRRARCQPRADRDRKRTTLMSPARATPGVEISDWTQTDANAGGSADRAPLTSGRSSEPSVLQDMSQRTCPPGHAHRTAKARTTEADRAYLSHGTGAKLRPWRPSASC